MRVSGKNILENEHVKVNVALFYITNKKELPLNFSLSYCR